MMGLRDFWRKLFEGRRGPDALSGALFGVGLVLSAVAYLTIVIFEPHSIYAYRLARRGELLTHNKDKAILTLLSLEALIEKNFTTVTADMDLRKFTTSISKSQRDIYPVVDVNGKFLGVVSLNSVKLYMFRTELYRDYTVRAFMKEPPAILTIHDSLQTAMEKFENSGAWNIPVVDDEYRYIGFISRSGLFNRYRQTLKKFSQE